MASEGFLGVDVVVSRRGSAGEHLGLVRPSCFGADDGALEHLVGESAHFSRAGPIGTPRFSTTSLGSMARLVEAHAARLIGQDRGRSLADGAAAAVEGDVGDALLRVVEAKGHRQLVATGGVRVGEMEIVRSSTPLLWGAR